MKTSDEKIKIKIKINKQIGLEIFIRHTLKRPTEYNKNILTGFRKPFQDSDTLVDSTERLLERHSSSTSRSGKLILVAQKDLSTAKSFH